MNEQPSCAYATCDLEQSLLQELHSEQNTEKYRAFASQRSILSGFPTALALLRRLREMAADDDQKGSSDEILGDLLRLGENQDQELQQHLLLLILMPAVHKTSRQIAAGFPSLARDDIAQHLLTTILQILQSRTLLKQQSHFAFAITRLMRRRAFRWALRETRFVPICELGSLATTEPVVEAQISFETEVLLREFLQGCLSSGQLTEAEHGLLLSFKIEGIAAEVLAAREGLSEIAFRHRMQRVIDRLRRIARSPSQPAKRRVPSGMAASLFQSLKRRVSAA